MLPQQLRYFAEDNTSTSSEFRSLIPSQTSSSLSQVVRLTLEFPVFGKFLFLKLMLWAPSKVEPEECGGTAHSSLTGATDGGYKSISVCVAAELRVTSRGCRQRHDLRWNVMP
ncbi:hypothetical protein J6590_093630 [Homalodisca vitripennis]|nr:hypothetical protein J6590_093630 [Homalodisca vitripennis]